MNTFIVDVIAAAGLALVVALVGGASFGSAVMVGLLLLAGKYALPPVAAMVTKVAPALGSGGKWSLKSNQNLSRSWLLD